MASGFFAAEVMTVGIACCNSTVDLSHLLVKWWNIIRLFSGVGWGLYLMCVFFPVCSYITSTLKMWLTEHIITNVLFHITSSGVTPFSLIWKFPLFPFISCPLTKTSLATQHLIRNHTFPFTNIGVCGVLIKCCTKPPDSLRFLLLMLSFQNLEKRKKKRKNPRMFLFLEFSHNPPLQASE